MFFFGAFSGNFIYLLLAISYLAGCSALAFRNPEDQTKDHKSCEGVNAPVLFDSIIAGHSLQYYSINDVIADQVPAEVVGLRSPIIQYSKVLFNPILLSGISHFSGSALFSRPPPFFLV
jgi:hypothetical protein